jgi:hypothetical protein
MTSSSQTDRATALISDAYDTSEEKIAVGDKHIAAIKACKELPNAPEVETATKLWEAENDALRTNHTEQAKKAAELEQLRVDEAPILRRWNGRRRGVLTAVDTFADGSKDMVKAFGFDNETRAPVPLATVPQELRPKKTRQAGVAAAIWNPTRGAEGYLVQHASDPKDQATYSPEIACKQAKFELHNQPVGTILYFRVLALDPDLPNGKSAFTDWVAVLVRD